MRQLPVTEKNTRTPPPPPPPPSEFSFPFLDITLLCLASSVGQSYASERKLKFDKSDFQAITLIKQACIYISGVLTKTQMVKFTSVVIRVGKLECMLKFGSAFLV